VPLPRRRPGSRVWRPVDAVKDRRPSRGFRSFRGPVPWTLASAREAGRWVSLCRVGGHRLDVTPCLKPNRNRVSGEVQEAGSLPLPRRRPGSRVWRPVDAVKDGRPSPGFRSFREPDPRDPRIREGGGEMGVAPGSVSWPGFHCCRAGLVESRGACRYRAAPIAAAAASAAPAKGRA